MLYKKGILLSIALIVLIGLGLWYTVLHHDKQESTITYEDGQYRVIQQKNEFIKIHATNLVSHEEQDEVLTKKLSIPAKTPLNVQFSVNDTSFSIYLTSKNKQGIDQMTTIPTTKKYKAYIPYSTIKEGKVGFFVGTDRKETLEQIENHPEKVDQFLNEDIFLLEQSILFEEKN